MRFLDDEFADAVKALAGAEALKVLRTCFYCGADRNADNSNHAPECKYWNFWRSLMELDKERK